jgi:hypothetical protein
MATMYRKIAKVKSQKRSLPQSNPFPPWMIDRATRINPFEYARYTTTPNIRKIKSQLLFGAAKAAEGFVPTNSHLMFNVQRHRWIRVSKGKQYYVRGRYGYRMKTSEAEKRSVPKGATRLNLLYGHNEARNKWVPPKILDGAGAISIVGSKDLKVKRVFGSK